MLALISAEMCERPSMYKRIMGKVRGYYLNEEYILGMPTIHANLSVYDGIKSRILVREAGRLSSELFVRKSNQVVIANEFPQKEIFDNFPKPDTIGLYESVAGDVGALTCCNGEGTAAFFARNVGIDEERTLIKLAGIYRYIIVVAEKDSDAICQGLRSRFGIPVISSPTENQIKMADYAAMLTKPRSPLRFESKCMVFSPNRGNVSIVTGGRRIEALKLSFSSRVTKDIPSGFDLPSIISVAMKYGVCSSRDIKVKDIRLDNG